MSAMTLEQVRDALRGSLSPDYDQLFTWADAIDAHLSQPVQGEATETANGLILELGLDPERFRTEAGFLNTNKLRAAIRYPNDYEGLYLAQPAQSVDDAALLDFMGRECLTVRCESTDDDDVEWDVVSYHMDAPKERVSVPITGSCVWAQDGDNSDTWSTGCGNVFLINEGAPSENGMRFCCYCGKSVEQYLSDPEEDDHDIS